ncbi:MAG: hypothetical protein AAGC64_14090, partial [Bacteroidota bacterium]
SNLLLVCVTAAKTVSPAHCWFSYLQAPSSLSATLCDVPEGGSGIKSCISFDVEVFKSLSKSSGLFGFVLKIQ